MSELKKYIDYYKEAFPDRIAGELLFDETAGRFSESLKIQTLKIYSPLKSLGITNFYEHQAEAIASVQSGKNVVVVTGTSSGKSFVYLVPILETLLNDSRSTSFLVFPTKALAQDQLALILKMAPEIFAATYDGDTPMHHRRFIRENARLVLTNVDMLHAGILPNHKLWGRFLKNLCFVAVDEAHVYRGAFGSNAALILRRLERIAKLYGTNYQYILSTATLANPEELAEKLTGKRFITVSTDASKRPEKTFLIWNPPFLPDKQRRLSANFEATNLFVEAIMRGLKTIVFSGSKVAAELITTYAKNRLKEKNKALVERIATYRAGYLPKERREIEKQLFNNVLLGVSATSALELGIDVGELSVSIINGFPGTISSFFQQAGRAGRRIPSLTIYIAGEDPLDQYYALNYRELFEKPKEAAIVDVENPYILEKNLLCSAFEYPVENSELKNVFGAEAGKVVDKLMKSGQMTFRKTKYFLSPKMKRPHSDMSVRTTSRENYQIIEAETGAVLGFMDEPLAYIYIHPGAVYLHQADSYLVKELDLDAKVAVVEKADVNYYTRPREDTRVYVEEVRRSKVYRSLEVNFGRLTVESQVLGYQKRHVFTQEVLAVEELTLPPHTFETTGLWFVIPEKTIKQLGLDHLELAGGIHGIEHAHISLLPLYAGCDRWDIGGVSTPAHFETDETTVFIYDGIEGGLGYAEKGYEVFGNHLTDTYLLIEKCPCEGGCPGCIQSPKCGNLNEPLDKAAAIAILQSILMEGER